MKVIGTEVSQILASRIADTLRTTVVDVKFSRFPDGEHSVRASGLDDEMVIVGSILDSDSLVQLLLLIDACSDSHNRLVVPYMGYARQDKRFRPGEPVSARAIALAISRGIKTCTTVNIHDRRILSHFGAPVTDLSVAPDIGDCIRSMDLDNPLIIAPDDGAIEFARQVAAVGSWDCDHLDKTRISGDEVVMAPKRLSAGDRSVVIVDDIISTGGTTATACSILKDQGAKEIHAACVHGIFASGAYARLKAAGIREIFSSDTIERGCSRYTAAGRIAGSLGS